MPASEFEAIAVPNIGAYGRMVPFHAQAAPLNVGGSWSSTIYTVPAQRVLSLDFVILQCRGGTLPTMLQVVFYDTAATLKGYLMRDVPPGINLSIYREPHVWLPSGWSIVVANGGGDATTDMMWSISGRLFDWTDFA